MKSKFLNITNFSLYILVLVYSYALIKLSRKLQQRRWQNLEAVWTQQVKPLPTLHIYINESEESNNFLHRYFLNLVLEESLHIVPGSFQNAQKIALRNSHQISDASIRAIWRVSKVQNEKKQQNSAHLSSKRRQDKRRGRQLIRAKSVQSIKALSVLRRNIIRKQPKPEN